VPLIAPWGRVLYTQPLEKSAASSLRTKREPKTEFPASLFYTTWCDRDATLSSTVAWGHAVVRSLVGWLMKTVCINGRAHNTTLEADVH